MNEDTLNIEGGLFEEVLSAEDAASIIKLLLAVVVVGIGVVDVTVDMEEAETEKRLVFDVRELGGGEMDATYRSALLNGNVIFGLLDEGVAGVVEDEDAGLAPGTADDEDVGLPAGVEGTFFVGVEVGVVCINLFAVESNLARRLEVWDGPATRCATFPGRGIQV